MQLMMIFWFTVCKVVRFPDRHLGEEVYAWTCFSSALDPDVLIQLCGTIISPPANKIVSQLLDSCSSRIVPPSVEDAHASTLFVPSIYCSLTRYTGAYMVVCNLCPYLDYFFLLLPIAMKYAVDSDSHPQREMSKIHLLCSLYGTCLKGLSSS